MTLLTVRSSGVVDAGRERGFSLVELLVAMGLMALLLSGVVSLVTPAETMSMAGPGVEDVSQRARIGREVLFRDLVTAGAGGESGGAPGALIAYLPPVLPRRLGLQGADGYDTARGDVITLLSGSAGAVQTTTGAVMGVTPSAMVLSGNANCAVTDGVCGFGRGMAALMFDRTGHFDLFTVTGAAGPSASIERRGQRASYPYAPGAFVIQADMHTYYFDAPARQLRHYDGRETDSPVLDNVVSLQFEYFGDAEPPVLPRPPIGEENCLYDTEGHSRGAMVRLAAEGGSLAPLPLAMLRDGPWCGADDHRYDADLLRVRKIRVALRVQAAERAARGRGDDYAVAGTADSGLKTVPDYEVRFDVSPRNLGVIR